MKKCVLVDGSSYLFRAYHALPPLTNSKGQPTGAVYGVVNMLKKLVREKQPDFVGVIFDAKGKTFRHELYPEYKANRPSMPEELACQIEPLHKIIKALGFPLIVVEGVEADDVIGTYVQQSKAHDIEVLISTGDKDLAQLVCPGVTLVNTMTQTYLDVQGVYEKFGVYPEQIIDYLALVGDTSDNVPGVPKVGPKTAAKWLSEYQNLDNLVLQADQIKGKVGENLRNNLEQLAVSKSLVKIKQDCYLPVSVETLVPKAEDLEALKLLFSELEFNTWSKELGGEPQTTPEIETNYQCVLDPALFEVLVAKLENANCFVLDTETNSLNSMKAKIVGLSFCLEDEIAYYIPLMHTYVDCPEQLNKFDVLERLKPILESPKIGKVGQNLKYDWHVFKNEGITLHGISGDTMLQSYVLNSTSSRHDMDSLARYYLKRETITYEMVAGSGKKQIPFSEVDIETATNYAAEDAEVTHRLFHLFQKKLDSQDKLQDVYSTIELPLLQVIGQMERNGVKIDAEKLAAQSQHLEVALNELEQKAFILAEEEFNLSSVKQLQQILYEKLGLPVLQKTAKGAPSTAESALQDLSTDFELPQIILEYRSLSKLKSTYTDKLPLQINSDTGRVHTSYHQAVTATGRLSSSDPNLQNIPVRTQEGRKIRQAFICEPGGCLIAADYSQIELRIMAHLSQDAGLLKAFNHGEDIHKFTASELFHVGLGEVSSEQRRRAKAINFGLIYGMSAFGLAKQLDIPQKEASEYMQKYFERYPGVLNYMETIRHFAKDKGYVETLLGRRLYVPDINNKNVARQRAAERTAINAPMQGTAADIIKAAMLSVQTVLERSDINAQMIMQVHDELVFEVTAPQDSEETKQIVQIVRHNMENAFSLSVPLIVDVGVGLNWDEAH